MRQIKIENIPEELKQRPQGVAWRGARTSYRADSTDPATWCDFNEAVDRYRSEQVAR